jgi:small-conductance mechanosensitive channel
MSPEFLYTIGISVAIIMAMCWSFILDKQKPPSIKEFIAKLVARALFIVAMFAVLMGFLYLAFGVFR